MEFIMTDDLEYIDRFYKGDLSPAELTDFEQRVVADPAFADAVAFYATALQTLNQEVTEGRKKRFREIYQQTRQPEEQRPVRKLWPYVAAAAVLFGIIVGAYVLFFRTSASSPQQMADVYLREQLQTLGVTMSSQQDSLQQGKSLYNDGKVSEALQRFETLAALDTTNIEATKLAGIAALRLQQYDKALKYFERLENYPGLFANPGKFYHALTLLKRDQPGDRETAKRLLQQVVENDLDKKEIARQWLEKW